MQENINKRIKEWLEKQEEYVGDTEDISYVCLDGWFDLEDLASYIKSETLKEVEESVIKYRDLARYGNGDELNPCYEESFSRVLQALKVD